MQNNHASNTMDWIATSLRWLILLSMTVALAFQGQLNDALILVIAGATIWNVVLSILAVLSLRLSGHRLISVIGDGIIASLLFYFSGAAGGELFWAGLLPLSSAALYYRFRGAWIVSLLNTLYQTVFAFLIMEPLQALAYGASLLVLYLLVGTFFGWISRQMVQGLARLPRSRIRTGNSVERTDQESRRALYNLISVLSSSFNYQRILDSALDLTAQALNTPVDTAYRLISAFMLFSEKAGHETGLPLTRSRGFTPADMRLSIPAQKGLVAQAITEGTARLGIDPGTDPELKRFVVLHQCASAYCVPLRGGLESYGVLFFAHPDEDYFTPGRREIIDMVGSQVVIAIQNARLYQDLELEKERMLEIQEEARKKIARDLHDGPTQSIAAIAMRVNFARRLFERDPQAAAEELFKIEEIARRTTKEIRHMLFTLRPLVLESQGLVPALESMAAKTHETFDQNVIIQADPNVADKLESAKQAVIFYIAEEAVNNARKHAKAPHVWVRLKALKEEMVILDIEDDGVGFNVNEVDLNYNQRGSLGMINMRERAELVNGVIHIDSNKGHGTRIQVVIPVTAEASERIRNMV